MIKNAISKTYFLFFIIFFALIIFKPLFFQDKDPFSSNLLVFFLILGLRKNSLNEKMEFPISQLEKEIIYNFVLQ